MRKEMKIKREMKEEDKEKGSVRDRERESKQRKRYEMVDGHLLALSIEGCHHPITAKKLTRVLSLYPPFCLINLLTPSLSLSFCVSLSSISHYFSVSSFLSLSLLFSLCFFLSLSFYLSLSLLPLCLPIASRPL